MNTETRRPRPILSARDRQRLKADIALCERDIAGGIGTPAPRGKEASGSPMPERMRQRLESNFYNLQTDPGSVERIRRARRALAAGDPGSVTPAERRALEKVRRDFEEWARANLMPKRMNGLRAKDEGFQAAVKAAMAEHSPEFTRRAEDYRNAMRRLDPDNPDAGNIEKLRPD